MARQSNRGDYNAVLEQILNSIPSKAFSCDPYEAVSNRSTHTLTKEEEMIKTERSYINI